MAFISIVPKTGKYRVRYTDCDGVKKQMSLATGNKKSAQTICNMVDKMLERKLTGEPDLTLSNWLKNIPDDLRQRLEKAGLIEGRVKSKTLSDLFERFQNRQDVEEATLLTYKKIEKNLTEYFGSDCELTSIDTEKASAFQTWLNEKYCEATAKRRISLAKQLFNEAVRLDWVYKSPFRFCKGGDVVNKEKWRYFAPDVISKALDEMANKEHKAQVALMRFAGVRGASELYQMDWTRETIRWSTGSERGNITIFADKTKKHSGKEFRIVPLNPILEKALQDLFEEAKPGQLKMFPKLTKTSNPGSWLKKAFGFVGFDIEQVYNLRRSYCCDVMEAVGQDAKSYEALTGHSFAMGLKHYQQYHKTRQDKAEGKLMNFWTKSGQGVDDGSDVDKVQLILSIMDKMTWEEKERLFEQLDNFKR